MFFIDVILPIPIRQAFTYSVNKDEAAFLKPGMRVAVPFGKTKVYTAIVYQVHDVPPPGYETKDIDQILDESPIVTPLQLKHWEWMASYYMCTLGEVIRAALPSAFLLESETLITLSGQDPVPDSSSFTDAEFLIYDALQHQSSLYINDIRSILDRRNVVGVLQSLFEKKIVDIATEIQDKYTPKIRRYVTLSSKHSSEEALSVLLDSLSRAPKQKEVLLHLFQLSATQKKPIDTIQLQKKSGTTSSVINALIQKDILEEYHIQKDRVNYEGDAPKAIKELSDAQQIACQEIRKSFDQHQVTLLHGVTSSGKTEVYVQLIEQHLKEDKQVLYMLPEIALTTQLISRLETYFGNRISVFHSKYSLNERVEVWNNVLDCKSKAQLVIGARSAMFLPFQKLGLIILDEEHEPSFKQYSPSPRYHARDSAIVLGSFHKANILMGSATPSLESYQNAKLGKYGLVKLTKRFGNVQMPAIELVDIKEKHRKKQMNGHFSDILLEAIREALDSNEQIILFQNRRGFSPIVECTTCGIAPQCPNCDVSLTFHKYKNELRCHYCGYHMAMQISCVACGNETIDTKGFGTEQIETELKVLFPEHTIARMDQDTTRAKNAYRKLIDRLENEEIDILVGTQMLAKGLDFRNISLVGVMNADNLLNFPDFRAHERSYQLLQQVAGRAGRTHKRGKVLIQTFNPNHQILQQVSTNDYDGMYKQQTEERYQYKYPPFYRTIKFIFKHRNFQTMQKASIWFGKALEMKLMENVLGPEQPPVSRIRNQYLTTILVKVPRNEALSITKNHIRTVERNFNAIKEFASVKLIIDVDNY